MAANARDLKNNDTTDAGFDLILDAIALPAGDIGITRIDVGTGTALTRMDSSNPLFAQITAGSAVIGEVAIGAATGAAGDLAKAEDAAHTSGDIGVMSLTVRQNTAASTSGTDGDYQPFISDTNGRLHVIDVSAAAALSGSEFQVDVVASLPAGTNAIGKLAANSGVDIGDVDVLTCGTVTPGSAATNLGKAEDAVHASADIGVMALSVRQNTAASTSGADGDYQPLITDTNGRLHVNDVSTAAALSGNEFQVDIVAALPAGTNAIGKLSANSGVDIGDVDVLTCGTITPGTSATSLGKAEDAAHISADVGVMALSVRQNAAAATSGTDGDYQPLITDTNGRLHVIDVSTTVALSGNEFQVDVVAALPTGSNTIGAVTGTGTFVTQIDGAALTSLQLSDNTVITHNVGAGVAVGNMMMAQRDDEVGSTATTNTDGDAQALTTNKFGQLKITGIADATSEVKYAVINAASGDNQIVAAAGVGVKVRVLNVVCVAGATTDCRFESAAGGTALTGIMKLTAQTGFAPGETAFGHFQTADNAALSLECTGDIDGWLVYVEV